MTGYWSSPSGERQQRNRRRAETIVVSVDIEPQRKGRRGTRAFDLNFQDAVRDALLRRQMAGWPRADLAVDFWFWTSLREPAAIQAYAKHYQDLLEPRAGREPPFLFLNDRQVKMLYVRCDHRRDGSHAPSVMLECRPRRYAIAELEAADRLGYDEAEDPWHWDHHHDWVDDDTTGIDQRARDFLRQERRRSAQQSILHRNDRLLARTFAAHAASLISGRPDPIQRALTRLGYSVPVALGPDAEELLDMLIQVPLPGLPIVRGDGERFRDDVTAACERFVDRNRHLYPLLVPLRITLLIVPPQRSGKDLDNIVIEVIGAVTAALRPSTEPWGHIPRFEDAADRRRGERPSMRPEVVAYQAIQLNRSERDSPSGTLTVILGDGYSLPSLWEEAASLVEKRIEELEDRR